MLRTLTISLILVFLTSCGMSKLQRYPKVYTEKPVTILVLPPINKSTATLAKSYYATTISEPLTQAGYYVLPYEVTTEVLKNEGLYNSEELTEIPLDSIGAFFGADAVLYTTINEWDKNYWNYY